jgi:hypothetical protein
VLWSAITTTTLLLELQQHCKSSAKAGQRIRDNMFFSLLLCFEGVLSKRASIPWFNPRAAALLLP